MATMIPNIEPATTAAVRIPQTVVSTSAAVPAARRRDQGRGCNDAEPVVPRWVSRTRTAAVTVYADAGALGLWLDRPLRMRPRRARARALTRDRVSWSDVAGLADLMAMAPRFGERSIGRSARKLK